MGGGTFVKDRGVSWEMGTFVAGEALVLGGNAVAMPTQHAV